MFTSRIRDVMYVGIYMCQRRNSTTIDREKWWMTQMIEWKRTYSGDESIVSYAVNDYFFMAGVVGGERVY